MRKKFLCVAVGTCLLLSSSFSSLAGSSTHEGSYNGNYYKLTGSINYSTQVNASMHYAGGGLVSLSGSFKWYKSEFYSEDVAVSAMGTGTASKTFNTVIGWYERLWVTGYVKNVAVDSVSVTN